MLCQVLRDRPVALLMPLRRYGSNQTEYSHAASGQKEINSSNGCFHKIILTLAQDAENAYRHDSWTLVQLESVVENHKWQRYTPQPFVLLDTSTSYVDLTIPRNDDHKGFGGFSYAMDYADTSFSISHMGRSGVVVCLPEENRVADTWVHRGYVNRRI
jgi:hypothetical protein